MIKNIQIGAVAKKAMCSKIKIKGCSVFHKVVAYALSPFWEQWGEKNTAARNQAI